MNTRSLGRQRYVDAAIDHNLRAVRIRQVARRLHQLEQRASAQILFANLNPGNPLSKISGDGIEQRLSTQSW
jgi:hypothetical protein